MAQRPIFVPDPDGDSLVRTLVLDFNWHPGFSKSQAQRSIASLHGAAASHSLHPVLEISTKSVEPLGAALSAFNLELCAPGGRMISVESAYQGSKRFEEGGPYADLYQTPSREAKQDQRLRSSGQLAAFEFFGELWPLQPETAFYDWLYITALRHHPVLADQLLTYQAFSDIAFNPERSLNCQARAAALYVSMRRIGVLEQAMTDRAHFIAALGLQSRPPVSSAQVEQGELFG